MKVLSTLDSSTSSARAVSPRRAFAIPNRVFPRILTRTKTGRSISARRNAFFVSVSLLQFRIWWAIFFLIHCACFSYFAITAYGYWILPETYMGMTFETYMVSMKLTHFPFIAISHGVIAASHAFFLLRMLLSSMLHQRFTFGRPGWRIKKGDRRFARFTGSEGVGVRAQMFRGFQKLNALWIKGFSRRGIFGIESKHFDLLFALREIFESSLQSMQAYRMSLYVPRVLLNRFYVATIVINCWSSPVVQYLYAENPPLARLLCLVLDIVLDFVSTVGIPVALILPYREGYDSVNITFDFMLWYDDFWLVNMLNEFKLLFVSSWADFVARMFFSVSLLVALQNVKSLLRKNSRRIKPAAAAVNSTASSELFVASDQDESSRWKTYPPFVQFVARTASRTQSNMRHMSATMSKSMIPPTAVPPPVLSKKVTKGAHVLFWVWGLGVLALHLRGEFRSTPEECSLSVRPWFSRKSACSLIQINCLRQQLTCTKREMDAILDNIDEETLAHIVIRHCPRVEISPRLKMFSRLVGFKIYNSTLVDWGADAALTRLDHPHMVFLFLVFVNMSSFPEGLLSDDFPHQLLDIEFSGTNLTAFPENLHTKWPNGGGNVVVFEQGILTHVPPVMEYLRASFMSLVNNQITEIPSFVFTNKGAITIWLSGNPIESLPEPLQPSRSIERVHLGGTKLKALPAWMDDQFFGHATLNAGGSPFCDEILASLDANASAEPNSSIPAPSRVALAAFLNGAVTCDVFEGDDLTYYPSIAEASLDESTSLTTFF